MVNIEIYEDPMAAEPAEKIKLSHAVSFKAWVTAQGFDVSQDLPFEVSLNGRAWPVALWDELQKDAVIVVTKRMFGASLLIAAVISIGSAFYAQSQIPDMNQQNVLDLPDQSPTYDANVQTNAARLGQPVPAGFGYQRIVPDLATRAHRRYVAGKQVLYHVLSIGHFEHTLHNPKIGDSPFSSFEGVKHQYYTAGEQVDLFASDVHTNKEVSRIDLTAPNDPDYSGDSAAYVVCPAGDGVTRVEYDFVINGLYHQDKKTGNLENASVSVDVTYQKLDENDEPVGIWELVASHTFTDNTVDALRFTEGFDVSYRGRVRMVRSSESVDLDSTRLRDSIEWAGLKAFLDTDHTYDHAVWAVEIPVTDQIGAAAHNKITVERQTLLPVWDENGWSSAVATRNPIWAICAMARSRFGANYTDGRLNLVELKAAADGCDARQDYFDYQFDTKTTVNKAIKTAARACRGEYTTYGNRLSIVRDEYRELAQMQFGMRQIERASIERSYPKSDTGDKYDSSVEVECIDPNTWETTKVLCVLPGDTASRPFPWKFEGCTNVTNALKEGMYLAARRKYRNRVVGFKTEMDGQLVKKGMSIGVSYAISGWGQSGDILESLPAGDGGQIIALREAVKFEAGEVHQIVLRGLDGRPQGPFIAKPHGVLAREGEEHYCQFLHLLPDLNKGAPDIYTGFRWDKTSYNFGVAEKYEKRFIVTDHVHQGNYKYQITAEYDDPRVYDYDDLIDSGVIPVPEPADPFTKELALVSGFRVDFTGTYSRPFINLTWQGVDGADRYVIQGSRDNGATWLTYATVVDLFYRSAFDVSINKVRISAMSTVIGPWLEKEISLTDGDRDSLRPNKVSGLALSADFVGRSCAIVWDRQIDANQWRISVCDSEGVTKRTVGATNPEFSYSAEDAKIDGLGRHLLFKVWAINADGDSSFEFAELNASNPQIGALTNIIGSDFIDTAQISANIPSAVDFEGFVVWLSSDSGFEVSDALIVSQGSKGPVIGFPVGESQMYGRIAGYDAWGKDELEVSSEITFYRSLIDKSQLAEDLKANIESIENQAEKFATIDADILAVDQKIDTTKAQIENASAQTFNAIDSRILQTEQGITAQTQSLAQMESNVTAAQNSANLSATIATEAKTSANTTLGIVNAQLTFKVSSRDADGTYRMAGFGLSATNEKSRVLVYTDKFGIMAPGAGSALSLAVENGKTIIATADIGTASITSAKILSLEANKISTPYLSALSANLGYVTAGYIRSTDGQSYLDLNTGAAVLRNAYIKGTIEASAIVGGTISGATGNFSGTLTASAINAVDTINLRGQAVSTAVLWNPSYLYTTTATGVTQVMYINTGGYAGIFSMTGVFQTRGRDNNQQDYPGKGVLSVTIGGTAVLKKTYEGPVNIKAHDFAISGVIPAGYGNRQIALKITSTGGNDVDLSGVTAFIISVKR